jgi:hypothetical protein
MTVLNQSLVPSILESLIRSIATEDNDDNLLLEDGDNILLEDGSKILLE